MITNHIALAELAERGADAELLKQMGTWRKFPIAASFSQEANSGSTVSGDWREMTESGSWKRLIPAALHTPIRANDQDLLRKAGRRLIE